MINNILKKIEKANEVQKVELAKHEVNLGLKEEVLSSIKSFNDSYKKVDDGVFKFYNQLTSAKKQYESTKADINNLLSFENKLKEEQSKVLNAGKELGIDVTGAPFYKELSAALVRFDNIKTELKDAENSYKSIKQ